MKTFIIAGVLLLIPFGFAEAATDYFLKLGGVEGETKAASGEQASLTVQGDLVVESGYARVGQAFVLDATQSTDDGTVGRYLWKQVSGPTVSFENAATAKISVVPKSAGTYVFELMATDATGRSSVARRVTVMVNAETSTAGTIKAETTSEAKGNVEMNWKVEEGEKGAPGVEPDEIDYDGDDQPITPDFGILLGGGVDVDDDGDATDTTEEGLARALEVLTEKARASDAAVEQISLNYEKISTKVRHEVKILGFIPVSTTATVDIDAEGAVDVRFPWWTFIASGADKKALGQRILDTLTSVLADHRATTDGLLFIRY